MCKMQKQNISMSRFGTNQAVAPHQELQPPKMFVEPCHLWAKLNSNANDCCKCNFPPNVVLLPTSWIFDLTSLFPCSFIEWTQYRSLFCCCCWKLSHWSWCAPFYWMFEWILSWKESRNVKVVFLCFTGFPVCLESGRKGCAGAETRTDEWYQLWKHSHLFFSFSSFPLAHALTNSNVHFTKIYRYFILPVETFMHIVHVSPYVSFVEALHCSEVNQRTPPFKQRS